MRDKLPPHSIEAEAGALACVLIAGDRACELFAQLEERHFYDVRHRNIFRALTQCEADFDELTPAALCLKLKGDELRDAGGIDFIAKLPDAAPSPESFPMFLGECEDFSTRRQMLREAAELERKARDTSAPVVSTRRTKLPAPLDWETLSQPVDYSNNLLGDRFLELGQAMITYGPAGCGKSVASLQASTEWSAGLPGLHIRPARPLKIVIVQTEDSIDDQRESLAGILASSCFTAEALTLVRRNLIILPPVPGGTGRELAALLDAACREHSPDMINVNPLLAFCPGDPARELGGLLYQVIDPVLKNHRVSFLGVHHTPKTNNRDTSGYGAHDHQYLAAGDARVANWPRAMIQIEPVAKGVYRFRASKRGHRTGWTWDRKPTTERYFKHHPQEVRWIDASPEDAHEAQAAENYRTIVSILPTPDQPGVSRDRVRELAKSKLNIGKDKADSWLKLAIEDGAVERTEQVNSDKRHVALFRAKEVAHAA